MRIVNALKQVLTGQREQKQEGASALDSALGSYSSGIESRTQAGGVDPKMPSVDYGGEPDYTVPDKRQQELMEAASLLDPEIISDIKKATSYKPTLRSATRGLSVRRQFQSMEREAVKSFLGDDTLFGGEYAQMTPAERASALAKNARVFTQTQLAAEQAMDETPGTPMAQFQAFITAMLAKFDGAIPSYPDELIAEYVRLFEEFPELKTADFNTLSEGARGFMLGRGIGAMLSGQGIGTAAQTMAGVLQQAQEGLDNEFKRDAAVTEAKAGLLKTQIESALSQRNSAIAGKFNAMSGMVSQGAGLIRDDAKQAGRERVEKIKGSLRLEVESMKDDRERSKAIFKKEEQLMTAINKGEIGPEDILANEELVSMLSPEFVATLRTGDLGAIGTEFRRLEIARGQLDLDKIEAEIEGIHARTGLTKAQMENIPKELAQRWQIALMNNKTARARIAAGRGTQEDGKELRLTVTALQTGVTQHLTRLESLNKGLTDLTVDISKQYGITPDNMTTAMSIFRRAVEEGVRGEAALLAFVKKEAGKDNWKGMEPFANQLAYQFAQIAQTQDRYEVANAYYEGMRDEMLSEGYADVVTELESANGFVRRARNPQPPNP